MKEKHYDLGDEIFYVNSKHSIGIVVGIRETRWSDSDWTDIIYVVETPRGSIRNVCGKDVESKDKI